VQGESGFARREFTPAGRFEPKLETECITVELYTRQGVRGDWSLRSLLPPPVDLGPNRLRDCEMLFRPTRIFAWVRSGGSSLPAVGPRPQLYLGIAVDPTGVKTKPWAGPLFTVPQPVICPDLLIAAACAKNQPVPVGIRLFRSFIPPVLVHTNA
jgi:hypothetical protein